MDRMNFYKCNLIFIGLVRVQGLTYSFHKSFILDTRYLTLKSLLLFIPPFLFLENNIKRTFFIQDLECGTIESDIFLPCLEYTFLLFFAIRIIHQRGVVLYSKILCIVVQSHHHHHWRDRREAKCKKKAITHTPFKEEDSRHKISNNNCSCQRTEEARKANVCIRASFLSDIPGLAIYSDGVSAYTRNINLI